ncbi:MAG TPA: DUF4038 domain-containing protein, partial [Bryobacteraceae bacterium]|nr:DUF4038 domain-containing protein [Bryobacteraceae bacterium]
DTFLATHLAPPRVERFTRFEAAFTKRVEHVSFTAPSGKRVELPTFVDGDAVWRVRFSPDETGEWQYSAGSVAGLLRCVPYAGTNALLKRGPLKISTEGHHFLHADGTPFFWLGDTVWNGPLLADMRDWRAFLSDRQSKGFNVIQFVTTQWSAAVGDATGRVPYRVNSTGKLQIDLAFFQRLDGFVDAINEAGMVAAPILLWAHTSQPKLNPGVSLSDEHAIELARHMLARWGAHQIVWFLNGDGQYVGSAERWKKLGRAVFTKAHPHRLSSMHPARMSWLTDTFAGEPWFHFNGYQSGHRDDEQHLRWLTTGPPATSWRRDRPIPNVNLEPNYEAHRSRVAGATHYFDAFHVRRAAYWSVLSAPPAGVTYGAHGIWSWETQRTEPLNHAGTGIAPAWNEAMRLPGSTHMLHLKTLMHSVEWWKLRPAHDALAAQPGEANAGAYVSAARTDLALIAYAPTGSVIALRDDAIARYSQAHWYDPRTGKQAPAHGRRGRFEAPDANDWVLLLKGQGSGAGPQASSPER